LTVWLIFVLAKASPLPFNIFYSSKSVTPAFNIFHSFKSGNRSPPRVADIQRLVFSCTLSFCLLP
jgi:hypothetical protein